jgi:hypothetical protein
MNLPQYKKPERKLITCSKISLCRIWLAYMPDHEFTF